MSKGDRYRPVDHQKFSESYDRIFKKKVEPFKEFGHTIYIDPDTPNEKREQLAAEVLRDNPEGTVYFQDIRHMPTDWRKVFSP